MRATLRRVSPIFKKHIKKDLKKGDNVLIVASHNSLRALVKHIEKIKNKDIANIEIDYGGLIKYEFDKQVNLKKKEIVKIRFAKK